MNAGSARVPGAISIRGIRLTNLALDDALNAIDGALAARTPVHIAFVNADCVNLAARDAAYQEALEGMDWVFTDGIGMKIAGQLLGRPVRANVNGTDLFPRLCGELAGTGRRLFLLGARPGVAAAAAAWAQAQYPGLVIAGTRDGYFDAAETAAVLADIRAARPDVLLVAMGAPRQEKWMHQHAANSTCLLMTNRKRYATSSATASAGESTSPTIIATRNRRWPATSSVWLSTPSDCAGWPPPKACRAN